MKKFIYIGILSLFSIYSFAQGQTSSNAEKEIRRISFAGSSVTWGGGFLQSGLVGDAILNIQRGQATTIEPQAVKINGDAVFLDGPNDCKFFGGEAVRINGIGASIQFTISGDELTLVQGIERSNERAAEMELYVDGALYDTFTNWNNTPIGSQEQEFKGDGKTKVFDLGRAFTYGHKLTVDGKPLAGAHNQGGYGGGEVPDSLDYLIIRKYGTRADGNPEVHHWISFKQAPAKDAIVHAVYSYGEEISYEKTTIGKSADGILESPFGDGDVSFDITKPTRVSSGLDYRQTDDRAVKTYHFDADKERSIEIRIKGNAKQAKGTPYYIFNFATNRFFAFQNAGIGGWKLSFFNREGDYYRSYKKIAEFNPDVLYMETTPNDDWDVGGYRLYTEYANLKLDELQAMRTLPIKSIAYDAGTDTYDFQKWLGKIADINKNSVRVQVDETHRLEADPKAGDYVFVGGYFSNNQEYAVRRVRQYDAKSQRIYFDRPLSASELIYKDLDILKGMEVRVRSFDVFEDEFRKFVKNIRGLQPDVQIATIVNPLPIIGARELWGYWELMEDITGDMRIKNLPVSAFYDFQFNQNRTKSIEIDASKLALNPTTGYMEAVIEGYDRRNRQNFAVLVNGKNVYGTSAVVRNPYSYGVDKDLRKEALEMDWRTEGVRANQGINQKLELIFLKGAPGSGPIELRFSTNYWSGDACHVRTGDKGSAIYGAIYYDYLKQLDKQ